MTGRPVPRREGGLQQPPSSGDEAIERAVREYFRRLFRWLTPLFVVFVALVLIALGISPSKDGNDPALPASASAKGETRASAPSTRTPVARNGAAGTSKAGVACGPDTRQVTWSKYAPPCTPAFEGDNAGSTSHGVTKDTITIVIGFGNTAENRAIQALAGNATPDDKEWAETIRKYADYFNTQFETYGRKVEVKTYQMRSDYILADMGRDTAAAQADARTAKDLGAFADLTALTNTSSAPYGDELSRLGIVNWSYPLRTASYYEANAPYAYNFLLDGSKWAKWASDFVCTRMEGLPAAYGGNEVRDTKRKFGLIELNLPSWKETTTLTRKLLEEGCGVTPFTVSYNFDLGTFFQYGASMMSQMRQQGVTTILCPCDPLGPIFMTQAASQSKYYPEWIFHNQGIVAQNYDVNQMTHALSTSPALPALDKTEAFQTYRLAYRNEMPPSKAYFSWIYGILLQFFSGVQMAGPNLTPQAFHDAMASLPTSQPGGDYGPWWGVEDGPYGGQFTPWTASQVTWWDAGAVAPDGSKGYWVPCADNAFFSFNELRTWEPKGQQLPCFRR